MEGRVDTLLNVSGRAIKCCVSMWRDVPKEQEMLTEQEGGQHCDTNKRKSDAGTQCHVAYGAGQHNTRAGQ